MGRQTVTALGTLVALAVAFLGYEQTLGRLTDFEPIDVALLESLPVTDEPEQITRPEDEIAAERAFGPVEGAKLKLLKMYQVPKAAFSDSPRGRGLGVFIFFKDYNFSHKNDITNEPDPKLVRFIGVRMIYITGSPYGDGSTDDIYTLEADQAIIRFDREVELKASINAKPLAGWVEGNVRLRSNQGTAPREDDIKVVTTRLDYEKDKGEKAGGMIWSEKLVEVIGEDGMRIAGVGMEIELAPETPPPPAGTVVAKKKKAADVEKLRLLDQVDFHLMVEGEGHVLGGLGGASAAAGPTKPATPVAAKPKEKSPLDVRARGPFNYDLKTLVATFEKAVEVERKNPGDAKSDRLLCETLRLQFAEKPEEKPTTLAAARAANGAKRSPQQRTSLSTVEAFGPADTVVVIAESQKLRATGDHLFHDAVKRRTRLESNDKMVVLQDNVRIEGKSLLVVQDAAAGPNGKSGFSEALVEGPNGLFEVVEKEFQGPTPAKELVVRFNKTLRATPEKNGRNRMVDVDGGVELEVPKQPLLMTSEVLHVRLEEVADAKTDPNAATASKMEPTWVKAERSVNVSSPELDVTAGQSLTMHILPGEGKLGAVEEAPQEVADAAIKPVDFVALPDDAAPPKPTSIGVATTQVLKPNDDAPPPVAMKPPNDPTARPAAERKAAAAKKPGGFNLGLGRDKARDPGKPPDKVDLRAETVEVFAVKVDGKTEARRAEAIGNVFIRRDAVKSPDDAVEIKGEKADFFRSPKGDRMIVHGGKRPAEIINKKFHLDQCRHIDLDEAANMMTVVGAGKLTLVGAPLVNATDAPKNVRSSDKPFVVNWTDKMVFNGLTAEFDGDVATTQNSQRVEPIEEFVQQEIHCRLMTVYFKERLSFKGAKTESSKKMEVVKVVCDRNVIAKEVIYHPPRGKEHSNEDFFRFSGIKATYLTFDNVLREVRASGPKSEARFIERAKPAVNDKGQLVSPALPFIKTDAEFGIMTYRQDDKVVKLNDDVRTVRSPVADPTEPLDGDPGKRRPEAMGVNGEQVDLQERIDAEGRKQYDFRAVERVELFTKDYEGYGDEATYDQSRDRFLLRGAPAYLKKTAKAGLEAAPSSAEEIEYYVKSGRVVIHGGGRVPNLNLGDGFKAKGKGVPVKGARPNQN